MRLTCYYYHYSTKYLQECTRLAFQQKLCSIIYQNISDERSLKSSKCCRFIDAHVITKHLTLSQTKTLCADSIRFCDHCTCTYNCNCDNMTYTRVFLYRHAKHAPRVCTLFIRLMCTLAGKNNSTPRTEYSKQ